MACICNVYDRFFSSKLCQHDLMPSPSASNWVSEYRNRFNKMSKADVDSLGSPYDLYSIMPYEDDAFSKNGNKTITTKDGSGFTAQVLRLAFAKMHCHYQSLLRVCLETQRAP